LAHSDEGKLGDGANLTHRLAQALDDATRSVSKLVDLTRQFGDTHHLLRYDTLQKRPEVFRVI
jgi:hypothetical protein